MKLYFSPLACSLATRIALYEAGADAEYVEVDTKTKKTEDGADFFAINALGLVPALRMENGEILTENGAILQHVADRFPQAELAPRDPLARSRLHSWLCFIGTELHTSISPLLVKTTHEAVKAHGQAKAESRLSWLATKLEGRSFLLDRFSVADAYLFSVLNWTTVTPIRLERWPSLAEFMKRMHDRPAVARAFAEEKDLYVRELARAS
jgi:glutathione S-transferase